METGVAIGQKYVLTREIGRGGMGAVYEASHTSTGERVAVKVLFASKSNESNKTRVARFEREAIAIGKLETPHVVRVYEAGLDPITQQPYIAMEILHGGDLSQLLKETGPLRVDAALAIVAQACAGLYRAHEAGIIHRDIKPGNLFIARSGSGDYVVKLLDFGIAKINEGDDPISSELGTITETGALVGSPYYMSPEQAAGLKTIDHRADVWSLGIVLYKCLTGRTPYDSYSSLGQVILAVCGEDPRPIQEQAPWIPDEVARVVHRALQRDLAHRFQSAGEMYEALRPLLRSNGTITDDILKPLPPELRAQLSPSPSVSGPILPANAPGPLRPQAAAPAPAIATPMSPAAAPPKSRAVPIAIGVFAVLAVTLFAGVLFLRFGAPRKTAEAAPASASVATSATAPPPTADTSSPVATADPSPPTSATASAVAVTSAVVKPVQAKPGVKPTAHSSARPNEPGRLQGGVGGDVPF